MPSSLPQPVAAISSAVEEVWSRYGIDFPPSLETEMQILELTPDLINALRLQALFFFSIWQFGSMRESAFTASQRAIVPV